MVAGGLRREGEAKVSDRIDRRSFLARGIAGGAGLAVAGGLGAALAGCGSSGSTAGASTTGPRNGISTATPKKGGSVIFATEDEDNSFDPAEGQWDETGVLYARTVYDPLTIIAADGSVQPYLAQSVTPNPDYTVWTITARPGVTFHDGTVCDAAAIAGSMNHFLTGLLGTIVGGPIKTVVATDAQTVTVTLKQPWVPFDAYLAGGIGGQIGYIVAPAMIKAAAAAKNTELVKPIGTGPFMYSSWVPNEHFIATRNPSYWRGGMPYLDQITFRPIVDPHQRANTLEAGGVDMMHNDVADIVKSFRDNPAYGFVDDLSQITGEPDMDCLLLNLSKPPFNDVRARQALAYAFNPAAYKAVINSGLNPFSNQPFVEGTPWYKPVTGYPTYDPAQAKALVQQYAKDNGGKPPTFTLGSTTSSTSVQAAQFLAQEFNTVGMNCTLSQVQQDEIITDALKGSFQALEWRQFGAVDPDLNYIFWSPTTIFPSLGEAVNMARNTDPTVETLLQQGRTSTDPATRAAAYQQIAQRFAVDIPYIWTDRAVWAVMAQSHVQNWNNPTTPAGGAAYGMIVGTIWPTQIWLDT